MLWNLYVVTLGNDPLHFPVVHLEGEEFLVCGDLSDKLPTNLTDEGLIKAMSHVRLCYVGEFVSFNVVPV